MRANVGPPNPNQVVDIRFEGNNIDHVGDTDQVLNYIVWVLPRTIGAACLEQVNLQAISSEVVTRDVGGGAGVGAGVGAGGLEHSALSCVDWGSSLDTIGTAVLSVAKSYGDAVRACHVGLLLDFASTAVAQQPTWGLRSREEALALLATVVDPFLAHNLFSSWVDATFPEAGPNRTPQGVSRSITPCGGRRAATATAAADVDVDSWVGCNVEADLAPGNLSLGDDACWAAELNPPVQGDVECSSQCRTSNPFKAFVVGNNSYGFEIEGQPFDNLTLPTRDGRDMKECLAEVGYDVMVLLDADADTFRRAFCTFVEGLGPGCTVILYFSGHGVQIDGQSYLVPAHLAAAKRCPSAKGEFVQYNAMQGIILQTCLTAPC